MGTTTTTGPGSSGRVFAVRSPDNVDGGGDGTGIVCLCCALCVQCTAVERDAGDVSVRWLAGWVEGRRKNAVPRAREKNAIARF